MKLSRTTALGPLQEFSIKLGMSKQWLSLIELMVLTEYLDLISL